MNYWTKRSIELSSTSNYLDRLFEVYPVSEGENRPLSSAKKDAILKALSEKDKKEIIIQCITSEVSPIKDSYIGYIKKDISALDRNPKTVNRISSTLFGMGYERIIKNMERPAESNRQMGSAFKNWIDRELLGIPVVKDKKQFLSTKEDMILSLGDKELGEFARINLGYGRNRGLDFMCRYGGRYIIGEAKFISDNGGNQANQFDKAFDIFTAITMVTKYEVIPIAILDGVIYIEGKSKQYAKLKQNNNNVMSALLLKDFIYSLGDNEL